ncbi:toll/interleukin-1 receptor domain-containing protein [Hathewaya histolytica]|uniref:TIR domain n=1 Tax=Hathewaya histolytica TaxID=1498 RepID=A0A4U9RNV1_HATHI|nr:toll/interleukin-1 receptor domain-containing protein [Hathewaya histolytica]VTQ93825.1 TIR domain [Hathewaya histolytica]
MSRNKKGDVFLSYCWADKEIVDDIDNYFRNRGIVFRRDNRDIEAWESIRAFMNSIRESDYMILIISDRYLKSINCMYEILELVKEREYKNRIITVVLNNKIYDTMERLNYIKYWEKKYNNLSRKISEINCLENVGKSIEDLKRIKQISQTIGEFLDLISDLNNPSSQDVKIEILKKLNGKHIGIDQKIDGFEIFLNALDECKFIELALSAENPYGEKKYILEKYDVDNDIHGVSMKFYLKDINNAEELKLIVSDITRIEKNTMESEQHKKFYMCCKDRIAEDKYKQFIKMKSYGFKSDPQEEFDLLNRTQNIHRCILLF